MAQQDENEPGALDAGRVTAIAQLSSELDDPQSRLVDGVVTITWPFSIITKSIAFILAEPDFRLRNDRGQVRVEFHGAAGKALADAGIGGGDEVRISLQGAQWEPYQSKTRLPGTPLDWQMKFTNRLVLHFRRADSAELVKVDIDGPLPTAIEEQENPIEVIAASSPILSPVLASTPRPQSPPLTIHGKRPATTSLDPDEYASPAFLKRARVSYGSLFEGGIDDLENDGRRNGKTKKRSRFSMGGMGWRYSSKSPSPEPVHVDELEDPSEPEEEEVSLEKVPTEALVSASMVDEGSQTQWPSAQEPETTHHEPFATFVPPTPTPFGGDRVLPGQNTTVHSDNETADVAQSPFGMPNSQSITYGQTNNLFSTQPPVNPFAAVHHDLSGLPSTTISSGHDFGVAATDGSPSLDLHDEEIPIPENIFSGLPISTQPPGQSLLGAPLADGLGWQTEADSHEAITAVSHSLEHEIEGVNVYPDPELHDRHHHASQDLDEPHRATSPGRAIAHHEDDMSHKSDGEVSSRQEVATRHAQEDLDAESSDEDDGEDNEDDRTAYEVHEAHRLRREKEGYDLSEEDEEGQYDEEEHYDESDEEEGEPDYYRGSRYEQDDGEEDEDDDEEDEEGSEGNEYDEEDEDLEHDHRTPVSQATSSQQVVIDLISDSEDEDSAPPPAPRQSQPAASPSKTSAFEEKKLDQLAEAENETKFMDRTRSPDVEDGADPGGDKDADADAEGEETKSVGSAEHDQSDAPRSPEDDDQDGSNVEPPEVAIRERNEPTALYEEDQDEDQDEEQDEEEAEEEEDVEMVEYKEPHEAEPLPVEETEADKTTVPEDTVEPLREPTPPPATEEEVDKPGEDPMDVDETPEDAHIIMQEQSAEVPEHVEEPEPEDSELRKPEAENIESTLQKAISPPPTQATPRLSQEEHFDAVEPASGQLPTPGETQLPPDEMVSESEQVSVPATAEEEPAAETKPRRSSRRKLDRPEQEHLEIQSQQEAAEKPEDKAVDEAVVESVEELVEEAVDETSDKPASLVKDEISDQEQEDSMAAEEQIMEEFLQYHSPTPKSKPQAETEPLITVHSLRSHDKEPTEATAHDVSKQTNTPLLEAPRLRSKRGATAVPSQGKDEPAASLSPRRHRKTRSTDSTKSQPVQPGDQEPSSPKEMKPPAKPTRMVRVTRRKASKGDPSIALAQSVPQEDKPRDASPPIHRPVTRSMDDILEAESEAETAPSTRMTRRHATPEVTELAHGPSTPTQIMDYIESAAASEEEEPVTVAEEIGKIEAEAEASVVEPLETTANETSTSKDELLKHLKDKLPDYLPLDKLSRARDQQCDILGIAASTPDRARRPRHGPRDYMLEVALTDPSLPSSSVRIAQFYRPHIRALPVVDAGDVVMLRKVDVLAMRGRDFGVKIGSESAWAVYQKSSEELLPQINGPPVEEVTGEEVDYVKGLRDWWDSLNVEAQREAEEAAEKSLHVAQQDEGDE